MKTSTSLKLLGGVVALLIGVSQQQQDPLANFCRIFGHQTTVIDQKFYIDGGQLDYNPITTNYTNPNLLYADLQVSNQGMPQEYNNLSKPGAAPDVSGGILWPDTVNKKFYLYGGEFQAAPQTFQLWSFDTLNKNWTSVTPSPSGVGIQRASWGAGLAIQDKGVGYYYGGWLSNTSVPGWGATPQLQSYLLAYDMVGNKWTNASGPDAVGRAEGIMTYIPAGDGGMLVYFGGVVQATDPTNTLGYQGMPMNEIMLYDIVNNKWYTQNATGQVPEMRRRFCGGAAWAADYSSYNIYFYGGLGFPPNNVGFDDVYILTIPSFQWIKWYPKAPGPGSPHHSLQCQVINGNQMLVQGGTFPNSTTQCDAPAVYGFHNLDLTENNSANNSQWLAFNNSKKGYQVPPELVSVIGGNTLGAAATKTPSAGFANADLSVLFTRAYTTAPTRSPTRAIPSESSGSSGGHHHLSGGAIAGIVIGSLIGGALLLGLLLCLCVRGRRRRAARQSVSETKGYGSPATYVQNPDAYHGAYVAGAPGYAYSATSPAGSYPPGAPMPVQLPAGEGGADIVKEGPPIELGGREVAGSPHSNTLGSPAPGTFHSPSPSMGTDFRYGSTSPHASMGASPTSHSYYPSATPSSGPVYVASPDAGETQTYFPPPSGSGAKPL